MKGGGKRGEVEVCGNGEEQAKRKEEKMMKWVEKKDPSAFFWSPAAAEGATQASSMTKC